MKHKNIPLTRNIPLEQRKRLSQNEAAILLETTQRKIKQYLNQGFLKLDPGQRIPMWSIQEFQKSVFTETAPGTIKLEASTNPSTAIRHAAQ
jgi:hypothetical protein